MIFLSKVITDGEIASLEFGIGRSIVDKHRIELVATAARNLHLAKSEANGPAKAILVGINAQFR